MRSNKLHIALVDDDEDDRSLFREALEEISIDANLSLFHNGQEFLDYLLLDKREFPQLVFLDLNMPVKNGLECLKEIRSNNLIKDLSIAIYSTSSLRKDIEDTFKNGANIYVKKPTNFNDLKKILEEVLKINWNYFTSSLNIDNFIFRF